MNAIVVSIVVGALFYLVYRRFKNRRPLTAHYPDDGIDVMLDNGYTYKEMQELAEKRRQEI